MMSDAVNALIEGNSKNAAESLTEIAQVMHKAGYPQKGFESVRAHIIREAERKSDQYFVEAKLKEAEKEALKARIFAH